MKGFSIGIPPDDIFLCSTPTAHKRMERALHYSPFSRSMLLCYRILYRFFRENKFKWFRHHRQDWAAAVRLGAVTIVSCGSPEYKKRSHSRPNVCVCEKVTHSAPWAFFASPLPILFPLFSDRNAHYYSSWWLDALRSGRSFARLVNRILKPWLFPRCMYNRSHKTLKVDETSTKMSIPKLTKNFFLKEEAGAGRGSDSYHVL